MSPRSRGHRVTIDKGKTIPIRMLGAGKTNANGLREVFFHLNGMPRSVLVADKSGTTVVKSRPKADTQNKSHVGAPMPGLILDVRVTNGATVKKGQPLFVLR